MNNFKAIDSYCNVFTYDWLYKYNEITDEQKKFDYVYSERLKQFAELPDLEELGTFDQIIRMNEHLELQRDTQIGSNYCQAITWYVSKDGNDHKASPCLQRIWTRWYPGNLIDMHLEWRSRDLLNAWQSNIVAITKMMQDDVFEPCNCKLARIVDFSDSLHIYASSIDDAKKVTEVRM